MIEYETDWNIDVEQDVDDPLDGQHVQVDDEHDHPYGTPVDRGRSVSVASNQVQPVVGRRSTRAPQQQQQQQQQQKKPSNPNKISESIEPDGHLPGYKDGVGVFPPGSDLAELMLALKLRGASHNPLLASVSIHRLFLLGKKYRTKKERLRIEKGGPPLAADGSLDYSQRMRIYSPSETPAHLLNTVEDPFSVLSAFVPDPLTRPRLTPLYPTDPSHPFRLEPTTIPLDGRPEPILSTATTTTQDKQPHGKRRHWTLTRGASARSKTKDREEDEPGTMPLPPREAHTVDWGSLALLTSALHAEMAHGGQVQMPAAESSAVDEEDEEETVKETIRDGLQQQANEPVSEATPADGLVLNNDNGHASYWTRARAIEAEMHIQEAVYGGVDGYAYVRSLAEFVGDDVPHDGTVGVFDSITYPTS